MVKAQTRIIVDDTEYEFISTDEHGCKCSKGKCVFMDGDACEIVSCSPETGREDNKVGIWVEVK